MCITAAKIGQGQPKSKDCIGSLTSAIMPNINILGQVIRILEPESQKSRSTLFDFFAKVKVIYVI